MERDGGSQSHFPKKRKRNFRAEGWIMRIELKWRAKLIFQRAQINDIAATDEGQRRENWQLIGLPDRWPGAAVSA
jgi:hypothetical protein